MFCGEVYPPQLHSSQQTHRTSCKKPKSQLKERCAAVSALLVDFLRVDNLSVAKLHGDKLTKQEGRELFVGGGVRV